MDKESNNIIEAGITAAEFSALFAGDITPGEYLNEYPLQSWRYGHLADLAAMRRDYELENYFEVQSGRPRAVDWCE